MHPLRIYLVGAGNVAYAHMKAVQIIMSERHVQVAVADPNPEALAAFMQIYPEVKSFNDAETMLAEPAHEQDIVVIAAPPFTHCALTLHALRSGRHVLCEKPLAMNMEEAQQMLREAKKSGRILGCCSSRSLGSALGQELRRLVQEGMLGELYHMRFIECNSRLRAGIELQPESPWFLERARGGGGVLMNLGPYDISFLNEILHPTQIDIIAAWTAAPLISPSVPTDVEQHVGATLRFHVSPETKVMVNYERAACTHGEETAMMELVGTKGSAHWNWFLWQEQARLVHTFEQDGEIMQHVSTFPQHEELMAMSKPLIHFYRYLTGSPSPALVNENALFHFACVQSIYACAQTGETQSVFLH